MGKKIPNRDVLSWSTLTQNHCMLYYKQKVVQQNISYTGDRGYMAHLGNQDLTMDLYPL